MCIVLISVRQRPCGATPSQKGLVELNYSTGSGDKALKGGAGNHDESEEFAFRTEDRPHSNGSVS